MPKSRKNTHLSWQEAVYVYTTDEKKDRIKIGMTARYANSAKEAVLERIGEQQTAGNQDEVQELLRVYDCLAVNKKADKVEKAFHKRFKNRRIKKAKQGFSEWFLGVTPTETDAYWNKIIKGIERPHAFPLRENQQRFVDKASAYYHAGGTKFLGAAIMRFGKTFATYELVRKMGWKRVLILSAKTDVKAAWEEDLKTHVNYAEYEWVSSTGFSSSNPIAIPADIDVPVVTFLSFQDAKDYDKRKLANVFPVIWDLVVVDETHFGTETELTDALFSQLNFTHRLDLSGTAYDKLMSGQYNEHNTFYYGLAEELDDISKGLFTYLDLPHLNLLTINIEKQIKDKIEEIYTNADEGFKFSTLFAVDAAGNFAHPAAVRAFLDALKPSMPYEFGGISPWHLDLTAEHMDHTVWFLPKRIAVVEALRKMLEAHPQFGNNGKGEYVIFQASGNNDGLKNEEILRQVEYQALLGKRTIVLSAGRFSTGVSKPKWRTVLMMNDNEGSPEEYFQSIFRCKTPDKEANKTECFAIDLNPDRTLIMQYKYAEIQTIVTGQDSIRPALAAFNKVLPIASIEGNEIKLSSIEDILGAMTRDIEATTVWTKAAMVNVDAITEDLEVLLEELDDASQESLGVEINANEVRKGKTKKTQRRDTNDKDDDGEEKQKVIDLRAKALSATEYLPLYLLALESEKNIQVTSVDQLLATLDDSLFEETTHVSGEIMRLLLNNNVLNKTLLTRGIETLYLTLTA